MVRIELTGQVRAVSGPAELVESDLPGRQGRLVLALLALAGDAVHRDVLAEALWPDGLPATWERTLSGVVSRLRSTFAAAGFEDVSIAHGFGSYELRLPEGAEVDVRTAAADVAKAERALAVGDLASARARAECAIAVARRPLLAGEENVRLGAERDELRAVLVRSLDVLAASTLGSSDAVDAAAAAVETDPFRESSHVLLMRAHAAIGNTAEALLAYERCRQLLADELGVDPTPETQALHVALLQADSEDALRRLTDEGVVGLPSTTTNFVGRAAALAWMSRSLDEARLVTLVGPGGIGKTRLAIEAARAAVAAFPDGVHLVDLTSATAATPLAESVAVACGMRISGEASVEALGALIGARRFLLVLDNCEHVIGSATIFVEQLLSNAPNVVVIATSREPLKVDVELLYSVAPLDLPSDDDTFEDVVRAEAATLFQARAASARPDFSITPANASVVAAICRRLDGVPLAIELAATRVASFGVREIAERLDERFAFTAPDVVPRHRTLRTTIDWSYDLLSQKEADVFRRCAAFEASFTADDAAAVCERDVGPELSSLADRSFVVERSDGEEARYHLLETMKQYARERIAASDEWETCIHRHIDRYVAVFDGLRERGDEELFLAVAQQIQIDATAALDRSLERERIDDAVSLACLLWKAWLARGQLAEGRWNIERTLAQVDEADETMNVCELMIGLGTLLQHRGDYAASRAVHERALAVATRLGYERARSILLADLASSSQSDPALMADYARQAIASADVSGHDGAAGLAHILLAGLAEQDGDAVAMRDRAELALERFTRVNHRGGMARSLCHLGSAAAQLGEPLSVWRGSFDRALELARAAGDVVEEATVLNLLGNVLRWAGYPRDAAKPLVDALQVFRRIDHPRGVLDCVEQLALAELEVGDARSALELISAVRAELTAAGLATTTQPPEEILERARSAGVIDADAVWSRSIGIGLDECVERALTMGRGAASQV